MISEQPFQQPSDQRLRQLGEVGRDVPSITAAKGDAFAFARSS